MDGKIAYKTFSLENDIKEVDPKDKLFDFDEAEQRKVVKEEPWKKEYAHASCRAPFIAVNRAYNA